MAWRVGSNGLRVIHTDGSESLLPPGSMIRAIPDRFDGSLELVPLEDILTYDDKSLIAGDYEVKA